MAAKKILKKQLNYIIPKVKKDTLTILKRLKVLPKVKVLVQVSV
jgi:hypothetical protein